MSAGYVKVPLERSDPRFPSLQQGFNRRWSAPGLGASYLCHTADGTAAALDDALASFGGGIKIKSGGHCYEDFVFNESTRAILDVTPMAGAGVDPKRGFYLDAGGTNWSAFEVLFRDYGKVLPAGSCYSVGLGGHICGGGYGLLSRLQGLTVDWLTGVDIVVKDDPHAPARVLHVCQSDTGDEHDLYWASCGGGGGNFGIITRYYFANLPPTPSAAVISTVAFDWSTLTADALEQLLSGYAAIAARDDNRPLFGLFKLNHRAAGEIQLVLQVVADDDDTARDLHDSLVTPLLRQLGEIHPHRPPQRPIIGHVGWSTAPHHDFESPQFLTFYEAVQTLNGSGPNQRGKYKSAYMRKPFPSDQVQAIFEGLQVVPEGLEASDMQQSLVQVDTYGGAINDVGPAETPVPQRSSILKLQYQTYWRSASDDAAHLAWIRALYSAVYQRTGRVPDPAADPTGTVDGCYYNYPDVDLDATVGTEGALRLYFLDNLRSNPRNLVAVKRRWDPSNVFSSAQSIPTR